jgi:hypothetical protein
MGSDSPYRCLLPCCTTGRWWRRRRRRWLGQVCQEHPAQPLRCGPVLRCHHLRWGQLQGRRCVAGGHLVLAPAAPACWRLECASHSPVPALKQLVCHLPYGSVVLVGCQPGGAAQGLHAACRCADWAARAAPCHALHTQQYRLGPRAALKTQPVHCHSAPAAQQVTRCSHLPHRKRWWRWRRRWRWRWRRWRRVVQQQRQRWP